MTNKYLHRDDAPFGEKVWNRIDEIVVAAAKSQLSGWRILHIDGPFGLELKNLPGTDRQLGEGGEGVTISASVPVPVVELHAAFKLPVRDVATFESTDLPFQAEGIAKAALACAQAEDNLIFNGSKAAGMTGLLSAKGTESHQLQSWDEIGRAADDLIRAITKLDAAGFHGPYAAALSPNLYNLLYRRYHQGNATEIEHVSQIITDGLVKAPVLKSGGVLIATGRQYASIVLGQDLAASFVGPDDREYEFAISESLALRLVVPESICILK